MHFETPGVLDLFLPDSRPAPLILDSPHSGREYPEDFQVLVPRQELHRVEDTLVDRLFEDAPAAGAALLCARFPRTYIDANRAISDIDPAMLLGDWRAPLRPSEKSRFGHGLVWRTFPPDTPLYSGRLPVEMVEHRIDRYWRPYHETLEAEIRRLHTLFGGVWHVNCHSMPSTSSPLVPGRGGRRADFVLGDREGQSCDRAFTLFARDTLESMGYCVRLNDPYRGAELVRAYAAPDQGRHSLQIEINRGIYLDEQTLEPGRGFAALQETLRRFTAAVADFARDQVAPAEAAE